MGKESRSRSYEKSNKDRRKGKKRDKSRSPDRSSSSSSRSRQRGKADSSDPSSSKLLKQLEASNKRMEDASDLLRQTSQNVQEAFGGRMDACEANLSKHTAILVDHEERLADALRRLTVVESSEAQLRADAHNLSTRIAQAEVQPPRQAVDTNFDRPTNPTRVKANAPQTFSKHDLERVVFDLLSSDGKSPESARIVGGETGKRFHIQFMGAAEIPTENATRFLKFLKNGDGTWKEPMVPTPGGPPQRLFFGPDISPKQERIEALTNKLGKILCSKFEDRKRVFIFKPGGTIKIDFVPVAVITVSSPSEIALQWNPEHLKALQLDKAELTQRFQATSGTGNHDIKWCS